MVMFGLILSFTSIHAHQFELYKDSAVWRDWRQLKYPRRNVGKIPSRFHKVFYGYYPYWMTNAHAYIHWDMITHVAYFSVPLNTDGTLGNLPNPSVFSAVLDSARNNGVEVHITITLFGNTNVSTFLNDANARSNAVSNIVNLVSNLAVDGVSIDFEFVTSTVRDSFNLFISSLYNALLNHPDGRKYLSIAMPAYPSWYPGYDVAFLSNNSDYLFVMAYDFHYSGSSTAGPVAPLYPSSFWGTPSVAKGIGDYISYGADRNKLILGVPYYGYRWPTLDDALGSSTTGTGSAVIFNTAEDESMTYGKRYDNYSSSPWYAYQSAGQWYQVWYDDDYSTYLKYRLVLDSSLAGAGCWALGYDGSKMELWSSIREALMDSFKVDFGVLVKPSALNVRTGPSTSYTILTTVHSGQVFVSKDWIGNWYRIHFPYKQGKAWGWVYGGIDSSGYLEGYQKGLIAIVRADILNAREGPSTTYPVITQVFKHQKFHIDSIYGNWARIDIPNISSRTKAWIHLGYADTFRLQRYPKGNLEVLSLLHGDTLYPSDTLEVFVKLKHFGYVPITDSTVLTTTNPRYRASGFYYPPQWFSPSRTVVANFPALPNQEFVFRFALYGEPTNMPGNYTEYFGVEEWNVDFWGGTDTLVVVRFYFAGTTSINVDEHAYVLEVRNNTLRFNLDKPLKIGIYDLSGRLILERTLYGRGSIDLKLPKGIYVLRAKTLLRKFIVR